MKLYTLAAIFMVSLNLTCLAQPKTQFDTTAFGSVKNNYPGGENAYKQYIAKNGHYPEPAASMNMRGATYVRFVIETDGSLSNIVIYKGIGAATEIESMRLIKESGKWTPTSLNGAAIRTRCLVPVGYFIEGDNKLTYHVNGEPLDSASFAQWGRLESMGTPLEEAGQYVNKNIKFVGKVYSYTAINDTLSVLTCGDASYHGEQNRIKVCFVGKDARLASRNDVGKIITG